jgi:phosphotransferase system enzyme I (PtsI)
VGEVLRGVGVSAGIAAGRVLLLDAGSGPAAADTRNAADPDEEISRLRRARDEARVELGEIRDRVREALGAHFSAIVEVQLLLLDDPAVALESEHRIRDRRCTAAAALHDTVRSLVARLESVQKGYMREHAGDLDDVQRRILRRLLGRRAPVPGDVLGPRVLVARSLGPAEAVALVREGVVALATDLGGPTSHTAILAKALSVPAVVGLHDVSRRVRPGDFLVVDGSAGEVELSPEPGTVDEALRKREDWLRAESALAAPVGAPLATLDGVPVALRANIELPEQVAAAIRLGAEGVGLCRSEFLFVSRNDGFPDEERHYGAYRSLAEAVRPHPVVIRTLDLGGSAGSRNGSDLGGQGTSLGLRAVRFCLERPDVFLPQLRGLLRSAVHGDVRILVPMVSSRSEILEVRRLLMREAEGLKSRGVACRADLPLGAMVELPAAAVTADLVADACDFLSIGTNDLVQFTLAVDRGSEAAATYYEPLHPAVLRMVDFTVRSARAAGRPVALCGEMAANPAFTGLLLGLGLRELSVDPRVLPAVAAAVRSVVASRSEAMAREVLSLGDAESVARRLAAEPPGAIDGSRDS